jgi:hypothetical protein
VETPIHLPRSSRGIRRLASIRPLPANMDRHLGSFRRPLGSTRRRIWIPPRRSAVIR